MSNMTCAGCGEVIHPREGHCHGSWSYHKGCLDKHLSKRIVELDREMSKRSAEVSALRLGQRSEAGGTADPDPEWPDVIGARPGAEPDVYDAVAEFRAAHPEARPDDGSDGQHYDLIITSDHDGPQRVRCVEVVEALGLKHGLGEALCAIWRMGKKPGETRARALRKAIYYLERELGREEA